MDDEQISVIPESYQTALKDKDEQEALKVLEDFRCLWYHSYNKESLVKSSYYSMLMTLNIPRAISIVNALFLNI